MNKNACGQGFRRRRLDGRPESQGSSQGPTCGFMRQTAAAGKRAVQGCSRLQAAPGRREGNTREVHEGSPGQALAGEAVWRAGQRGLVVSATPGRDCIPASRSAGRPSLDPTLPTCGELLLPGRTWRGADSVQCLSVSANPFASPRSVLWSRAQSRTRMRGRGRRSCRPSASSRADLNPRRPHAPWPRRGRITLYTAYAARGGREGGKARLTWPASNFLNERLRPSLLLVFAVVLAWARRSRPPGPALPWPAWAAWAPALLQYSNHP